MQKCEKTAISERRQGLQKNNFVCDTLQHYFYLLKYYLTMKGGFDKMKICICDDESCVRKEIKEYILPFFSNESPPNIVDCQCGEELIKNFSSGAEYDIIFLDIEMANINGIETANKIREISSDVIIIFVSSHKNYVFEAFKCEALHFIVKPISKSEFDEVFVRALHKYNQINDRFPISWKYSRNNLRIKDIMYIEGYRRHLKVHTQNNIYETVGKISDAYNTLADHGFVLIHQGYIVNMQYILNFRSDEVVLINNEKLMVSVRKRSEALQVYDKFIQKWKW